MIETVFKTLNELNKTEFIILFIFGLFFILRTISLFLFAGRIAFRKREKDNLNTGNPLSVLITVRNEEKNIKQNIPPLLKFDNIDYEVVAVDDFSQDNSFSLLGIMQDKNRKLKVSSLNQETRFSVKHAQNIALKAAFYDYVLVVPVSISDFSSVWLKQISEIIGSGTSTVVNYSNVKPERGFFNLLYRIEKFNLQMRSAGFILNRVPFIYSEENVAFEKKKYFEAGGYGKKITEPYANLELIVNNFILKKTSKVNFYHSTAIWNSVPVTRFDYYELLKKSIRIEKHLSNPKRLALFVDDVTNLLFLPVTICVIVLLPELWPIYAFVFFLKAIVHLFIIKRILNRLKERKIFISSFVYGVCIPYIKVFYRWYLNQKWRKTKWKSKT